MAEYIEREAAKNLACEICQECDGAVDVCEFRDIKVDSIPAADVRPVPEGGIGEMSDGYHTFNGLYYQRMVLFAAIVKAHKDKAWKSWKHEDGEFCFGGGWFIVGIDTPEGSFTYHYDKMYWNLFECKELPTAKHWDGHTEKDVTRLLSLDVRPVVRGKWEDVEVQYIADKTTLPIERISSMRCNHCNRYHTEIFYYGNPTEMAHFCPNCGADMREES